LVVNELGGPDITLTGDTIVCSGSVFELEALGADTYVWTNSSADTISTSESVVFTAVNNQEIYVTGTVSGCNTTLPVQLISITTDSIWQIVNLCEGESYEFNGTDITQEGIYTYTLSNQFGCDSVIILECTVNAKDTVIIEQDICEGNYYYFEGQNYYETGIYQFNYTNTNNCDSIVLLDLVILTLPDPPYIYEEQGILISNYLTGNQWYFNGNLMEVEVSDTLFYTQVGEYYAQFTDESGCISEISNTIYVLFTSDKENPTERESICIYPNPAKDVIYLKYHERFAKDHILIFDSSGRLVLDQIINNKIDVSLLNPGVYYVKVQSDTQSTIKIVLE
jgi:hypothetical protein